MSTKKKKSKSKAKVDKKDKKAKKKAKKTQDLVKLDTYIPEGEGGFAAMDDLNEVFDPFPGETAADKSIMANPMAIRNDVPGVKTITIVAETATYYKAGELTVPTGRRKLECGRAAAQAGHAVSKLKASYLECNSLLPSFMYDHPITNIVLKARDSEELKHVMLLANEKNLHVVEFWDEGVQTYGTKGDVLTAIAIGPVESPVDLVGVSDYLPLWTCGCSH